MQYGKYYLEIEFNRSPEWEKRHITKCTRGKIAYDPKKKHWKEKIESLYQELYKTKVKPKIKTKNENKLSK